MTATLGALVFVPGRVFQGGIAVLLSLAGELVVNNAVLLAAGVAVLAGLPTRAERPTGISTSLPLPRRKTANTWVVTTRPVAATPRKVPASRKCATASRCR